MKKQEVLHASPMGKRVAEEVGDEPSSFVDITSRTTKLYEAHKKSPDSQRLLAGRFSWPKAMMQGLLPWDASNVALEYLALRQASDGTRPTIREVKWLWRLHLASPTIPTSRAFAWVEWLSAWEYARERKDSEALSAHNGTLEAQIAIAPWWSTTLEELYEKLRGDYDTQPYQPDAVSLPFTPAILHNYVELQKGKEWADVIVAKERQLSEAGGLGVGDGVTHVRIRVNPEEPNSLNEVDND